MTAATRYEEVAEEPTLEEFLSRVALTSDQDQIEDAGGVVLLMTLHAAKGLEFPVVFIVGVEQGLLPHERSIRPGGDGDLEEERRLCFVGMTRAKARLTLSHAQVRLVRGQFQGGAPSQFLYELPEELLEARTFESFIPAASLAVRAGGSRLGSGRGRVGFVPNDEHVAEFVRGRSPGSRRRLRGAGDEEPIFTADEPTRPLPPPRDIGKFGDWQPGMSVRHTKWGVGRIVRISHNPGQTSAVIRFADHGEKAFILEFAPVTRLSAGGADGA